MGRTTSSCNVGSSPSPTGVRACDEGTDGCSETGLSMSGVVVGTGEGVGVATSILASLVLALAVAVACVVGTAGSVVETVGTKSLPEPANFPREGRVADLEETEGGRRDTPAKMKWKGREREKGERVRGERERGRERELLSVAINVLIIQINILVQCKNTHTQVVHVHVHTQLTYISTYTN